MLISRKLVFIRREIDLVWEQAYEAYIRAACTDWPVADSRLEQNRLIRFEIAFLWTSIVHEVRFTEITEGTVVLFEAFCFGGASGLIGRFLRRRLEHGIELALRGLKAGADGEEPISSTVGPRVSAAG